MVERAGLENRCRCKPTVGSNPTSSAANQKCDGVVGDSTASCDRTCGEPSATLR